MRLRRLHRRAGSPTDPLQPSRPAEWPRLAGSAMPAPARCLGRSADRRWERPQPAPGTPIQIQAARQHRKPPPTRRPFQSRSRWPRGRTAGPRSRPSERRTPGGARRAPGAGPPPERRRPRPERLAPFPGPRRREMSRRPHNKQRASPSRPEVVGTLDPLVSKQTHRPFAQRHAASANLTLVLGGCLSGEQAIPRRGTARGHPGRLGFWRTREGERRDALGQQGRFGQGEGGRDDRRRPKAKETGVAMRLDDASVVGMKERLFVARQRQSQEDQHCDQAPSWAHRDRNHSIRG